MREYYPEGFVEELALSIEIHGLVNPILVMKIPRTGWFWFLRKQYYKVIDGNARLQAVKTKRIRVQVINELHSQMQYVRTDRIRPRH